MKLSNVFNTIFKEEKENKNSKSLKIFYNIDIYIINPKKIENQKIQQEPTQQTIQEPTQQTIQQPTQQAIQQMQPTQNIPSENEENNLIVLDEDEFNLNSKENSQEEDYRYKNEGEISVFKSDYENIQSLEDLLDFLNKYKDEKGNQILNEAAIELILSMVGVNQVPLNDIVKKEDKILINILYGNKRNDSIGIKVLKRQNTNNLSIVMKKDNEILDTKFDLKSFNSQILEFRNQKINKI